MRNNVHFFYIRIQFLIVMYIVDEGSVVVCKIFFNDRDYSFETDSKN